MRKRSPTCLRCDKPRLGRDPYCLVHRRERDREYRARTQENGVHAETGFDHQMDRADGDGYEPGDHFGSALLLPGVCGYCSGTGWIILGDPQFSTPVNCGSCHGSGLLRWGRPRLEAGLCAVDHHEQLPRPRRWRDPS